jgi:formylglycine-generating enzyme required for sulfatase activity
MPLLQTAVPAPVHNRWLTDRPPSFMKQYRTVILILLVLSLSGCSPSNRESGQRKPAEQTDASVPAHPEIKDMVYIAAGPCIMGSSSEDADSSPDEKPVHTVFLNAYYIDKYEVTNMQYQAFVLATGHPAPFVDKSWAEPYNWKGTAYPAGMGNNPVVLVSWDDARAYAAWINKRLPTEAEWENAARAHFAGRQYPCGDKLEMNCANFNKGFFRENALKPVGSFEPNALGLYDMAGNVWEWCQDWYDEDYYKKSPAQNPQGPADGLYRVDRGGSWVNDKNFLRCAQRGKSTPDCRSHIIGFRCALSAATVKPAP